MKIQTIDNIRHMIVTLMFEII